MVRESSERSGVRQKQKEKVVRVNAEAQREGESGERSENREEVGEKVEWGQLRESRESKKVKTDNRLRYLREESREKNWI